MVEKAKSNMTLPSETVAAAPKKLKITWGPIAAVVVTIGIYFASQLFGGLLISAYPTIKGWSSSEATHWLSTSIFAQFMVVAIIEALTLLLLHLFLRTRKANFRTLGLRRPRLTDAGYALLGFGIYLPLFIGVLSVIKALVPALNVGQQQQLGFENAVTHSQLFLVFMSLVLLPPLVEEILARGFLYLGLKNGLKPFGAVALTSIIFASAHLQFGSGAPLLWVAAIDTFILSLVLIYLREKTNGLWASIGLHMLKNGIAFASLFIFHLS